MGSLALRGSLPSNSVIKMNEVNYERMLLMYECSQAGGSLITVTFTGRPGSSLEVSYDILDVPARSSSRFICHRDSLSMCWLKSSLTRTVSV